MTAVTRTPRRCSPRTVRRRNPAAVPPRSSGRSSPAPRREASSMAMWAKLPPRAPHRIALVAADAMAGTHDAGQLLDVEMEQFPGARPLVATRHRRDLQYVQVRPAAPGDNP